MPGDVVLDSGIIVALFFPEKISEMAMGIAESHECTTVDLAYAETANAAWKRVHFSNENEETVQATLSLCQAFIQETCQVIPAQDLVPAAFDLACRYGITLYDALYFATAVRCGSRLVTADTRLHTAAKNLVATELVREPTHPEI